MTETTYKYIRAWGIALASDYYYIENEVAKARERNAPADTVYFKHETGEPVRIVDCVPATQEDIALIIKQHRLK